jgi:hypothetical protein
MAKLSFWVKKDGTKKCYDGKTIVSNSVCTKNKMVAKERKRGPHSGLTIACKSQSAKGKAKCETTAERLEINIEKHLRLAKRGFHTFRTRTGWNPTNAHAVLRSMCAKRSRILGMIRNRNGVVSQ